MESMFQFTNPALTGLEFGLNEGFNSKENKEVQIQINMSVSVNRNESRNEGNATAESGENGNVVSAESLREVYIAVIALGLNRAMGNHDEESGIITIKSCRSNWNPRISG